jgi:hypothetical protein
MGYVLYVGFAAYYRATVMTCLCLYKKKRVVTIALIPIDRYFQGNEWLWTMIVMEFEKVIDNFST